MIGGILNLTERIKKAVEEFKSENGNTAYTTKDLMMYLVHRIDNLPCVQHVETMQQNKVRTKMLMWIFGISIGIMMSCLLFLFTKI